LLGLEATFMTGTETETHAVLETDAVHVVVGTCGDKIQYWAAAVPRSRAAREVRQVLGSEWKTKVMAWRLAPERLEQLKLKPNGVRQIG
jgi:hypothetical protein